MENIDHIARTSLDSLAKNNLSEEGKRHIMTDVLTGAVGIVALIVGFIFSKLFPDRPAVSALIYSAGIIVELIPIFIEALTGIFGKNLTKSMEILVAIAVTACFFSGELITAILIPLILNAAHILEERSIMGGRAAIDGLKKMQKTTAVRISPDGSTAEVNASELEPGDLILIRPGDGFPVDGTVVSGTSSVDQKSLTGEPEPVNATVGTKVFAGTVNIDGTLTVRADKKYADTSFSNIIKLLEQSEKMDIPESRLIDRFMRYYIPFILAIAAAVALVNNDLSRAVAILVVSCPCGQMLVSSAPMVAALSAATKRGILIKNSKFIEKIVDSDAVVFDKTGTLTYGNLSLTDIKVLDDDVTEALAIALADVLSKGSNHPVSRAVCTYADLIRADGGLPDVHVSDIRETPGIGMTAVINDVVSDSLLHFKGKTVRFGRYTNEDGILAGELSSHGTLSVLSFGDDNRIIAAFCFDDTARTDAASSIKELKDLGIDETVMLTGDRLVSAERIAGEAGIDTVYAGLLPNEKYDRLLELKSRRSGVIAVGDGINDALALREADVGIAMGAMGSDLAIQSADIALMNNRLSNIPFIIRLAGSTRKIIYQNLIISMLISAAMILLSSFGLITAVFGAFFHNVGAFTVLINSSRILRLENAEIPDAEHTEET